MSFCERCKKNEEYHNCSTCGQHLCISCFNTVHFGINAARSGKSMVYNKCIFCCEVYATNAKSSVCDKCTIILTWKTGMDCLAAVNRLSDLLKQTNSILISKMKIIARTIRYACHPSHKGCNRFLKEMIKINP